MKLLTSAPTVVDVRVALRDLAIASDGKTRRTYAVLGGLAGASKEELMDLGRFLVRLDITCLLVVGEAASVHAGAVLEGSWGSESRHVPSPEQALALLRSELTARDVVLVAGLPVVLVALEGAA